MIVVVLACSREASNTANPCAAPVSVDTAGWVRVRGPADSPSFLLPPQFQVDTTAQFAATGTRWRDGDRTFDAVVADWSESGFRPTRGVKRLFTRCNAQLAGRKVLYTSTAESGEYAVTVWFMPDSTDTRPSLALEGRGRARADQDVFLTAFRSVKLP